MIKFNNFVLINNPCEEFIQYHIKDGECIEDFLFACMRKYCTLFFDIKVRKIAGIFIVSHDPNNHNDNILSDFEVTPDYRGKGLSYQFLDYAVKRRGADHLYVDENNEIAKHLYLKYGFEFTGDKKSVFDIIDGVKVNYIELYMKLKKEKNNG